MANTHVQLEEVESWVRQEFLPRVYGQPFQKRCLVLEPGGKFAFDAVSADNSIVVNISTSGAMTSGGKRGAGKIYKLRSDMLFLHLVVAPRIRIIALTERDMYELCQKEKRAGRVPSDIEFILVTLPDDLVSKLKEARSIAAQEVSPLE